MLTPDFVNRILVSDSSLSDMIIFHEDLRDIEASIEGMLYPVIHTYKQVDLGGGALFPALEFINGWTLQFQAGNFTISGGNLKAFINPIPNCYVVQTQSAAYAITSSGGSGGALLPDERNKLMSVPTAAQNADAVFEKIVE